MPKTVLFSNPTAYSGKAKKWIAHARKLLREFGVEHEAIATLPDGKTVELVRRAIDEDGVRCAIAMGGDGTLCEVVNGILTSRSSSEVTLGMLPTGTANNQGKSFGMKAGAEALAANVRTIARGRRALLDVGRLQHLGVRNEVLKTDWFFDSMSVGWGAQIVKIANRDRATVAPIPLLGDIYRDQLVYAGASLQQFLASFYNNLRFHGIVEIDGVSYRYANAIDLIVKNTLVYGGEWIPAPDSKPDDGYFELIEIGGRREFLCKAIATWRSSPFQGQNLRSVGIHHSVPLRGSSFTFAIEPPANQSVPVAQIDGEEYSVGSKFRIDVCKRVLRAIVPRAYCGAIQNEVSE